MNVKTLSIVAALVAAFGASAAQAADEYTLNQNMPAPIAKTAPRVAERVPAVDEYQRNHPVEAVASSHLQRAQVVAEAIEARKLGLICESEQCAIPTAAQIEQIRLAGLKAVNTHLAGK